MSQSKLTNSWTLNQLGWQHHFSQQISLDEWDSHTPARVLQQHKSELLVAGEHFCLSVPSPIRLDGPITVGDWVLLDEHQLIDRVLDRKSQFSRKASGSKAQEQLIASNVDTLFVICSLNYDFNLNRIERYLVLAREANVEAIVILTKADECESEDVIENHMKDVQKLDPLLNVLAINALDAASLDKLTPWCRSGQTIALLGSSGVGKSTLTNLIMGEAIQATSHIREGDSKGRHTTTGRSLHVIEAHNEVSGGLILDTPGMRELQLAHVELGIQETFSDITDLAQNCKFKDCNHDFSLTDSSGCAVQAAIKDGILEERRLSNYLKLLKEDAFNSATLAEKRDKDRKFGKMVRSVLNDANHRKNR